MRRLIRSVTIAKVSEWSLVVGERGVFEVDFHSNHVIPQTNCAKSER